MTDLQSIAKAMGGEVHGNVASFPTPGHSSRDRGSWASIVPDAPDGVLINSKNGGDPLAIKDELRAKGVLPERAQAGRSRDVAAWEYTDADGVTLYRKVRMALSDGGKSFRFEHPDGRGGWQPKRGDARQVPYRLPDLVAAPKDAVIYMAEGEKQADKLASWGLVATSSKDWRSFDFSGYVRGRTVVILPDNDPEGAKIATAAKEAVERAEGKAVLLDLPGLPHKGDIMDWSGDVDSLRALVEAARASPAKKSRQYQTIDAAALDAMQFAPIKYIVPGILPEGLALLAGKPKFGKSYMALGSGIAVASGGLAFGSIPCDAGDVLYAALEDNNRRLQARLRSMLPYGMAKPKRLHIATDWRRIGDGGVEDIEGWLDEHPGARLVMLDTLARIKPKSDGRGKRRLLGDDVIHLKDRSDDGMIGRSRLNRARDVLHTATSQQTFARSFLDRGAQPSGVISHDGPLTHDQRTQLRESFTERHAGPANAGRALVLDGGLKWQAMQVSPEDAELLNSRRFAVEEIARVYGVPPPMIGDLSHGTFTNSREAARWFGQFTLTPRVRRLEAELNRALFGYGSRYEVEFDMSSLLRSDPETRWASHKIAIDTGVLDTDEVREIEGYNPRGKPVGEGATA